MRGIFFWGLNIFLVACAASFIAITYLSSEQSIQDSETKIASINQFADTELEKISERKKLEEEARIRVLRLNPANIEVIVNKKHPVNPINYEPVDLVNVYGAVLSKKASVDFKAMYEAARGAGVPFSVTSSYRSYNDQIATYRHWVSVSGSVEADKYSARPGYSEHQTGLVVDVAYDGCALSCFGDTVSYRWFSENAYKFGFIQRYQKGKEAITGYSSEEWHYRYIGKENALKMKADSISTLEEFWGFEGGDYAS